TSWRNVIAQVRNPDEDPRIDHLLTMAEEIYKASSTFRKRMNAVAGEGGVTIRIVPDKVYCLDRDNSKQRSRKPLSIAQYIIG
ncbi:hypothetical protein A253_27594, partial [Pseudomonas syringae pv. actinidiae ICMP 19102]